MQVAARKLSLKVALLSTGRNLAQATVPHAAPSGSGGLLELTSPAASLASLQWTPQRAPPPSPPPPMPCFVSPTHSHRHIESNPFIPPLPAPTQELPPPHAAQMTVAEQGVVAERGTG